MVSDNALRVAGTLTVLLLVVTATPAAAAAAGAATTTDARVDGANAATAAASVAPDGNESNATMLTVLAYNDVQTAASDPGRMGRLVGAVNDRRAAHDNPTVVVGGGDEVSPSSLSPISQWRVPVDVLNVVEPDAEVVGNHDLDYGFDAVDDYSDESTFPWLAANVVHEDGSTIPGTKNYTIVERDGVRVGIVGLVDDAIKSKTAVDFDERGYRVADFARVGDRIATTLKTEKDVDVVVAAAHIGVPESKELARASDAIDVIVTGDDEVAYAPQTTSGTTIVEAQARGAYVGEVNVTVTEDGASLASGRLVAVDENASVNETAAAIVEDARGEQLERVAGRTTVALDSTFASNYHDETAWGNLITDAFRAETGAAVAVTNAGGIRGNFVMEPGNVTYGDVYTSLPFGNYLVTKEMTGEQLRELLASQVVPRTSPYGAEAALQVSGVSYEFDPEENATMPVQDVRVNGAPLREDATYNVTVNSYMAGWTFEDRYGWSFEDLPTTGVDQSLYGSVVAEYVNETSPVSPADTNRIRRVDRHVGETTVPVPPGRSDDLTVRVDVPSSVTSVNASTVVVQNATTGSVSASSATVRDGVLVATFDRAAFEDLVASSSDLDLYAHYDSSLYDADNYFRAAVLNVDLDVPPGHRAGGPGNGGEAGERGPPSHAGPPARAGPSADDDDEDGLVAGTARAVAVH